MTFSLIGSSPDASSFGQVNLNPNNIMENHERAMMYVFKPFSNQFRDVGLRPLTYSFDGNFVGKLKSITDLARSGSARDSQLMAQLKNDVNLNDHMIPTPEAQMVMRTSHLSDNWRFILMFTETAADLIGAETQFASLSQANSAVRRIYTGYFTDEPYNPGTFSTNSRQLNPHAHLVITHKTVVGTIKDHGPFGARTRLNTTHSEEIIHPSIHRDLTAFSNPHGSDIHLMTPGNMINAVEDNGEGSVISVPGAYSNITRENAAMQMPDLFERPNEHLGMAISGIMSYQGDLIHRDRMSSQHKSFNFEDDMLGESMARMRLSRYMSQPQSRATGQFDLDVNAIISPDQLDRMVNGRLNVIQVGMERPLYYETADQFETSLTNQYSSLIADVVSPILASAGLNSMQFTYERSRQRGVDDQHWTTEDAQPMWPLPDANDIRQMAMAVEFELKTGVFDTIFQSLGSFHVMVRANCTGHTVVRLNLVEQGLRTQVDWEVPSCMGGFISPLIGNDLVNSTNTHAMEELYGVATGTSNISRKFDDDDNDFTQYARERMQEMPWEQQLTIDGRPVSADFD